MSRLFSRLFYVWVCVGVAVLISGVSLSELASLRDKLWITFVVVVVYRIGTYVPLPFVNADTYMGALAYDSASGGGLLSMVNALSGGALGRFSVFSLNVMPYIVASIISQLFLTSFDTDKKDNRDSNVKAQRVSKFTRYLTVLFATVQGFILSISMASDSFSAYASGADLFLRHFVVTLTLVAGTSLLVWMGEFITAKGIGNGVSVLIFVSIISDLPRAVYSTLELGKVGAYSTFFVLIVFTSFALLMAFVVFVERSSRNVLVYYPKRRMGDKVYNQQVSHIPVKINMAGVIPAIFANTVMLAPASLVNFKGLNFLNGLLSSFYSGSYLYYAVYFVLIIFFAFFYTSIIFNHDEVAENLRRGGGVLSGVRPGLETASHLKLIVSRLTMVGAVYIASVCVLVDMLRSKYSIPFALGGTSVLIVVSVISDVMTQAGLHVLGRRYDSVIGRISLKGGERGVA